MANSASPYDSFSHIKIKEAINRTSYSMHEQHVQYETIKSKKYIQSKPSPHKPGTYVYIEQGRKVRQEANIKKRSRSRINEQEIFRDIRAKRIFGDIGTTGI